MVPDIGRVAADADTVAVTEGGRGPGRWPPIAAAGGARSRCVPDIGDFDEVAVIELLVRPGDTVAASRACTGGKRQGRWRSQSSMPALAKALKVAPATRSKGTPMVRCVEPARRCRGPAGAAAAPVAAPVASAGAPAAAAVARRPRCRRTTRARWRCANAVPHASPSVQVRFAANSASWRGQARDQARRAASRRTTSRVCQGVMGPAQAAECRPPRRVAAWNPACCRGLVDFAKFGPVERKDRCRASRRSPAPTCTATGDDPARHQPRRGRHHRAGSLRVQLNKENERPA